MISNTNRVPKKRIGPWKWIVLAIATVLFGVPITGSLYELFSSKRDENKFPPPGTIVQVGETALHVQKTGSGSPVIILESGAGGTSLDWSKIQAELAEETTVVSYDRAGLGWSSPGPKPRTATQIAKEMQRMLQELELKPPYILVGHSFGGAPIRMFAANHPDDVAGLVLIDAIHEDFYERMPSAMRQIRASMAKQLSVGAALSMTGISRIFFPPLATQGLPTKMQDSADARGSRANTYRTVRDESNAFEQSAIELRTARPLPPNLPIVVLSRTRHESWPQSVSPEKMEAIWQELQVQLAQLSENATHISVKDAGHFIHLDQPESVIAAIKSLLTDTSH